MSSPRTGCRRRVCVGACARARTCECAHLTYSSTPSLAPRSAQAPPKADGGQWAAVASGGWTVGSSRPKPMWDNVAAVPSPCGSRPKPIAVRCSRVPVSLLPGCHPYPDPNPDPNPDINPGPHPDTNPDPNPDINPHPNPDVDPHPTPCGPSNVLCLLTGTASRKARTCTMRTCTMHMYYAHVLCTWPLAKRAHVPCMLLRTWTCACAHGRAHVHVHVGMRMCTLACARCHVHVAMCMWACACTCARARWHAHVHVHVPRKQDACPPAARSACDPLMTRRMRAWHVRHMHMHMACEAHAWPCEAHVQ